MGDSSVALRRLDFGVVGTAGTANVDSGAAVPFVMLEGEVVEVEARLLRFLLGSLFFFALLGGETWDGCGSVLAETLLVEMRAERLKDMWSCLYGDTSNLVGIWTRSALKCSDGRLKAYPESNAQAMGDGTQWHEVEGQ